MKARVVLLTSLGRVGPGEPLPGELPREELSFLRSRNAIVGTLDGTGTDAVERQGASAPTGEARKSLIAEAVAMLDPANDEHWTKSTKRPRVDVVDDLLGFDVSREELDGFERPEAS